MATELNYELVSDACAKAILATRVYREAACNFEHTCGLLSTTIADKVLDGSFANILEICTRATIRFNQQKEEINKMRNDAEELYKACHPYACQCPGSKDAEVFEERMLMWNMLKITADYLGSYR